MAGRKPKPTAVKQEQDCLRLADLLIPSGLIPIAPYAVRPCQ